MKIHKNTFYRGFTLLELMIVVAVIALVAAIAVPSFLRANKRGTAVRVLTGLRIIDSAKDQWAIDNGKSGTPPWAELQGYIKKGSSLYNTKKDILQNTYVINDVNEMPAVHQSTYDILEDAISDDFFDPYGVGQ